MDPIIMSLVITYFLFRRGGENAMWLARKDGSDPPSFRRWQERQKRRGSRGSVTGRAEGRKFWAHLWHDAHASAHEWRQRRHGRRGEDRRKRWQAQDVEREKQQALAPCVFCGAGQGEDCATDCPERQAHDTNRASGDRATVPPATASTEPTPQTEPSQPSQTAPSGPSHDDDTAPGNRATTTEPPFRASLFKSDEEELAFKEQHLEEMQESFNRIRDELTDADVSEHQISRQRLENRIGQLRRKLGAPAHANVTPINRNQPTSNWQAGNGNTTGGNVTGSTATGEITGYESTLAEMDQTLAHLEAVHADADQKVHTFEQLDAVYENRINALRSANADAETIGTQVAAREANETQIHAAKALLEASSVHLEAENTARARWVGGIGAMKETADATGAEGDRVLRS